jgi:hypothetical protein
MVKLSHNQELVNYFCLKPDIKTMYWDNAYYPKKGFSPNFLDSYDLTFLANESYFGGPMESLRLWHDFRSNMQSDAWIQSMKSAIYSRVPSLLPCDLLLVGELTAKVQYVGSYVKETSLINTPRWLWMD